MHTQANLTVSSGDLLPLYRTSPLGTRLHVAVRWRLFPFSALAPFVPASGHFVDLGCGHGVWSFYLARLRPTSRVLGLDPDRAKVAEAERIRHLYEFPNLCFEVGLAEDVGFSPCDLVCLIDVLYLVPPLVQEQILARVFERLLPGGRLSLKVMDARPAWKYAWNFVQEWLAVRALGITSGQELRFRPRQGWLDLLNRLGFTAQAISLDAGYLHPHLLLVADKPA